MVNDERRTETFIREVDEELRRDQLKTLWRRFAPLIIGVCVLVVAATAGYRAWLWWTERQAAIAGDRFLSAIDAIESGDLDAGEAALAAIASEGNAGYAALARLRLAGEQADAGETDDALAAYDAVSADARISDTMRSLARMRGALLALDAGDADGALSRAEPLNVAGNPWRHVAREVLGMAHYAKGEILPARDLFDAAQQDAETPPQLWERAGVMVGVIDAELMARIQDPSLFQPPADTTGEGATEAPTPEALDPGPSGGDIGTTAPAQESPEGGEPIAPPTAIPPQ
jgi:hypothetical protein